MDNPYRPPSAPVVDVEEGARESVLAGRGERLAASLADLVVEVAVLLPLLYAGGMWSRLMQGGPFAMPTDPVAELAWLAAHMSVTCVVQGVPLARTGQTWGKRLMAIRIVDLDGRKPRFARLLARRYLPQYVVGALPFVGAPLTLLNLLLVFRSDRRCGHDWLAGTRVVRNEPRQPE